MYEVTNKNFFEDDFFVECRSKLEDHGFFYLKKTSLSENEFERLCSRFGHFYKHEVNATLNKVQGDGHRVKVRNSQDGRPVKISWHVDFITLKSRPISFLYCNSSEGLGTATDVVDTYKEYPKFKAQFYDNYKSCIFRPRLLAREKKKIERDFIKVFDPDDCDQKERFEIVDLHFGEFLNMSAEQGLDLKNSMLNFLNSNITYSHKWEAGDILAFDNNKVVHRRSPEKLGLRELTTISVLK